MKKSRLDNDELVTKSFLEERLNSFRDEIRAEIKNGIHRLDEKLDKLIGMYKAHEEEQILQGGRISNHEDRLEVIEGKLNITSS